MYRSKKNKYCYFIWLLALSFISLLILGNVTYAQGLDEEMDADADIEEPDEDPIDIPSIQIGAAPREESSEERMLREKKERMHPRVEGVLWELQEEYINKGPEAAHEFARKRVLKIEEGDKITVFLVLEAGKTLDMINRRQLEANGVDIIGSIDSLVEVKIPIPLITQIVDQVEGISYIRLPAKPKPLSYLSEGVSLTGASIYHSAGYTGQGVKVAIIDLGFAGVSSAISNGELPGDVVMVDCTGATCTSTTFPSETEPHGTAVAEIVYDMAPGAQLYLIKVANERNLANAKTYCVSNGIKVINHSVGWVNQNFYDGVCYNSNPVCTANDAYANGILWVNAMGNAAERHYEATFTDSDANGWHEVSGNNEVISISATVGDTIDVFLTWKAWPTTDQDYDLYLYDNSMNLVASSLYRQTGTEPPTEAISYTVPSTGAYYLKIKKYNASINHHLELYSFNHDLTPHVTSSSLMSPADAAGAMAVSAIPRGCWTSGPQEPFSSQGPTNDGWTKPEISGPDGVSNYTYGSFPGTSASSPHVAGTAALILSKNPGYSVSQLWSALTGSAIDMGISGQDNIYGYGRLNVPALSFASVDPNHLTTQVAGNLKADIQEAYGKLPLSFIQNNGQVDRRIKFYEKGSGHATFFTKEGVYISLIKGQSLEVRSQKLENISPAGARGSERREVEIIKLTLSDANKDPEIVPINKQEGQVNYFIGNDPKRWKTNIPTYQGVLYKEVYKGIDMKFYGDNRRLEYDIFVKPGADPKVVKFSYEGIEDIEMTETGDLKIALEEGHIIQKRPYIYQEIDGRRVEVGGNFIINDCEHFPLKIQKIQDRMSRQEQCHSFGFEIAKYDKGYPLIIDPILIYSTYLGGSNFDVGSDAGLDITVDTLGKVYITGMTYSPDFPLASPIQGTLGGYSDVFVTKIDASGNSIIYSTYLGGSNEDYGEAIAVDVFGNAYITGGTNSPDFPLASPIQGTLGGYSDVFVTKIDASGNSIIYSTYLGGSSNDGGSGIGVDALGNAYITGLTSSSDFPIASPIQGTCASCDVYADVFVTKIDASGTSLLYSTFLGGSSADISNDIAVDTFGNAYIVGDTLSSDFPVLSSIQGTPGGYWDAFVTKINAPGNVLIYSTYLGGSSFDSGYAIAVDNSGNAYITGETSSSDFPVVSPLQGLLGTDAFVTKIDATGNSLIYSTFLGGSYFDRGWGIATDDSGNAYLTGETSSSDFPVVSSMQGFLNADAFITKVDPSGSSLIYSTYLGGSDWESGVGIAVDICGNAYSTGITRSPDFPVASPIQGTLRGDDDAFVTKISSLDTIPPAGSVIIEEGNRWTNTTSVTLTLSCADNLGGSGCIEIQISNDGVFDTEPFEPFSPSKAWTLPSGEGNQTVYVRYKDGTGNFSATVSDSIKLDTTMPVISNVSDSPDPFRHHLGEISTINFTVSDNLSDTCKVRVRILDSSGTEVRRIIRTGVPCPVAGAISSVTWDGRDSTGTLVPTRRYTYRVRARDKALNWSTVRSGTITVE